MNNCISRILLGGPADAILLTGDEITHVDEVNVMNYPKQRVVCLLKQISKTGYLRLKVRRRNLGGNKNNYEIEIQYGLL